MKKLLKLLVPAIFIISAIAIGIMFYVNHHLTTQPPLKKIVDNKESKINYAKSMIENSRIENQKGFPLAEKGRLRKLIFDYNTPILMAKYEATLKDPLPGEMYNVELAASRLAGTVIMPGEIFSQNKRLGPYTAAKGYKSGPMYRGMQVVKSTGGGVCKIASVLYNVAILSNFKIVERHNHSMTVPYVPPGQDATVYYGVKDFRFKNSTDGPIVIWTETIGNTLSIAFFGQEAPPKVTWHHEILKEIKYWTVYKTNSDLPKGTEKITIPGQNGYIIHSWISIENPDGTTEIKKLGKNYYNPLPEVIEKGV